MNKVEINFSGLEALRKSLPKDRVVRVGILGDSTFSNDSITNAELGVIHEFGTITNENIPPRSFLKMPLSRPELKAFVGGVKIKKLVEAGEFEKALELIGLKAEEIIDGAFRSRGYGTWAANTPETIARKGSSSPLIDTGELRRSITSEVADA